MRKDGLFIGVEVDDEVAANAEIAAKLAEVCPVDIYAQRDDGSLELVERNLDECVLCKLCLEAAPDGKVTVLKLYTDGEVLTR
jgi:ferredoxin-like protein FixX